LPCRFRPDETGSMGIMRAEIANIVDEMQQSIGLLRRHL
jgi:hypothetical protein